MTSYHILHFMSLRLRSAAWVIRAELSMMALRSADRGPGLPLIEESYRIMLKLRRKNEIPGPNIL
jgi:hypothetical protein